MSKNRVIYYTEEPIKSMWNRLGHLSSVEMAARFLGNHPARDAVDQTRERAESLAFAIRSAREYFHPDPETNVTESCLSYYYGVFNLVQALLISAPDPPHRLLEIEHETRNGHGLRNFSEPGVQFPEAEIVYFSRRGFARLYGASKQLGLEPFLHEGKAAQSLAELPRREMGITLLELLLRVPELRKSTYELWAISHGCVFVQRNYYNSGVVGFPFMEIYNTPTLTVDDIVHALPELRREWYGGERQDPHGGRILEFNVPPEHKGEIPEPYRSALSIDAYIEPVREGTKRDVLLVHLLILYLLSIFVRYRPKLWRRIIEEDLDWFRPLVSEYLQIVERIVPNIVLSELHNQEIFFAPLTRFV